jgi:alpha-ribazole phosphatase/probable phosphoglycerate mutase
MAVQLIYESHWRTIDNERGIATWWLPGELSATGRDFTAELGRRWQDRELAAVYSSDLRRALQTAEIAFADRNVPVISDMRLRECNYGALNGMPVARLEAEPAKHIDTPFPEGQSYRQVVDHMRSFLNDVAPRHQNQTILLIAHSANRWARKCLLLVRAGGLCGVQTDPDYRRRGFGRAAVQTATNLMFEQPAVGLGLLLSSQMAVPLYERLGWRVFDGPVYCEQPAGNINYAELMPLSRQWS